MFARNVRMKLKPLSAIEFSRIYEQQVLPVLRQQTGFRDGMSMVSGERSEALVISFWDRRESAEAFDRSAYAGLVGQLDGVLAEAPHITNMVVSNSTSHQIAIRG